MTVHTTNFDITITNLVFATNVLLINAFIIKLYDFWYICISFLIYYCKPNNKVEISINIILSICCTFWLYLNRHIKLRICVKLRPSLQNIKTQKQNSYNDLTWRWHFENLSIHYIISH